MTKDGQGYSFVLGAIIHLFVVKENEGYCRIFEKVLCSAILDLKNQACTLMLESKL